MELKKTRRQFAQELKVDAKTLRAWEVNENPDAGIAALAVDGKCARTAAKINGQGILLFGALDTHTQLFCRQIRIF